MTNVLESARAFARARFPVFPCGRDKRPRVKWKGAATTDDATICQWWQDWPDAMIGLPTGSASGLYVIDLDIDKETGEAVGEQTIDQLGLKAAIAGAPSALTASGGRHFYFRHPGDGWGNTARKIGAGIDTRGEGGYVIAPGSVNGAGAYQWTGPSIFDRGGPRPIFRRRSGRRSAPRRKPTRTPSTSTVVMLRNGLMRHWRQNWCAWPLHTRGSAMRP